jgi:uncharacterized membrane protein YcaP (DUF421 family)
MEALSGMLFTGWSGIARVLVVGTGAYLALVLLLRGRLLADAMRRERVTHDELLAAVRAGGHAGIERLQAVVLETDGSLSVIGPPAAGDTQALDAVSAASS